SRAIGVGERIGRGERIRTAKDANAVVKLEDGSLVEMKERSELSLSQTTDGTTINLNRGNVIVEAAKQRGGHLYVATDDALVSVTGTIFSVNNGTKGSRVSVLYAALPNLTNTLVESHRIMKERMQQNAALHEWLQKEHGGQNGEAELDRIIEEVNQFGKYLGTEIVASARVGEHGPVDPLVLA